MEKVNRILFDDEYRLYLQKNKALEEGRSFCHHNFEHLLAVARLTYLFLLEKGAALFPGRSLTAPDCSMISVAGRNINAAGITPATVPHWPAPFWKEPALIFPNRN